MPAFLRYAVLRVLLLGGLALALGVAGAAEEPSKAGSRQIIQSGIEAMP